MPNIDYMAQPVGVAIPAFEIATESASKNITFSFTVRGGQQVLSNTLRIYANNGSSTPLLTSTVESYIYGQTITTQVLYNNNLRNNGTYLFTFQTHGWGIVGYNGNTPVYGNIDSEESAPILFKTFVTPVLQFTNMPVPPSTTNISTIQMANYTFDCQYTQSSGELLSNLYFYMYDYNHTLINTSKTYTAQDAVDPSSTPQTGMVFEYTYQGFVDDTDYYIKAVATTINNTVVSVEQHLHIDYLYDKGYFQIKATNFANGGYVEVVNNVSEIDGNTTDKYGNSVSPQYIGGNYLLLDNSMLHFDSGYQINSNAFAKQKWWFPVLLGETTRFYNEEGQYLSVTFKRGRGEIDGVQQYCDYIVVEQSDGETIKRKSSNIIPAVNQNTQLTTYVKVDGDIITAEISTANIHSSAVWNGDSSIVLDGVPTDIVWMGESGSSSSTSVSTIDIDTGISNVEWDRLTNMFWADELYTANNPQRTELPVEVYNDTTHLDDTTYYKTTLQNAVVNEFYVTRNLTQGKLSSFPEWDNATVMLCDFNNTIIAGNVTWLLGSMDKIKLKRKRVNDTTNNWVTLWEKDIETPYDLTFAYRDYYVPSNDKYVYAMIPCVGNDEQEYFYSKIDTKFNGLFISDKDQTLKLLSNYGITNAQDIMLIGTVQPYQSRYPVIIRNPYTKYRSVTLQGDVLGLNYNADDDNCVQTNFDLTDETRLDIVLEAEEWSKFLCNGKTKIIRDWNGNIMMAQVTTPPSRSYGQDSGNSKPTMSFGVTEVGQYNNQSDLFKHGLVEVEV